MKKKNIYSNHALGGILGKKRRFDNKSKYRGGELNVLTKVITKD